MTVGVLKESNDQRVAITPEIISSILGLKVEKILIEKNAGLSAFYPDEAYTEKGAEITDRDTVLKSSDMIFVVNPPGAEDISKIGSGKILLGGLNPLGDPAGIKNMADKGLTAFGLEIIPRTSRAQAMDILSSMATVSGYKAVLVAASNLAGFFPMFMTAAGSITPAKVLILGAGVAGLQAIATAKRLGAVVEAFDVRAAAKEEVLSLGAKFVDVEGAKDEASAGGYAVEQSEEYKKKQQQVVQEHAAKSDVIICTAQIPGRKAPILIQKETVEMMKPGSVIVDLAASTGGNCAVTQNDQTITHSLVTIIGDSNLPSTMPADASKMFGKNILNYIKLIIKEGEINLNFEDDLVKGACVAHDRQVVNERVKGLIG
jgi:NAD(P) transhydrogenase subunit alpha